VLGIRDPSKLGQLEAIPSLYQYQPGRDSRPEVILALYQYYTSFNARYIYIAVRSQYQDHAGIKVLRRTQYQDHSGMKILSNTQYYYYSKVDTRPTTLFETEFRTLNYAIELSMRSVKENALLF